jgi:hypothetical protein
MSGVDTHDAGLDASVGMQLEPSVAWRLTGESSSSASQAPKVSTRIPDSARGSSQPASRSSRS